MGPRSVIFTQPSKLSDVKLVRFSKNESSSSCWFSRMKSVRSPFNCPSLRARLSSVRALETNRPKGESLMRKANAQSRSRSSMAMEPCRLSKAKGVFSKGSISTSPSTVSGRYVSALARTSSVSPDLTTRLALILAQIRIASSGLTKCRVAIVVL